MTGSDSLAPRSAWTRSLLLAAALLAALGTLALVAQAAVAGTPLNGGPAPLAGSTFQGADGNQKAPLPGDPDWSEINDDNEEAVHGQPALVLTFTLAVVALPTTFSVVGETE